MGLFSKLKCDECGKESRLEVIPYKFVNGTKPLCNACVSKMNVDGFISYCNYIGKKEVTYEEMVQYRDFYRSVVENEEYKCAEMDGGSEEAALHICADFDFFCSNRNFTTVGAFDKLLVETKDVFAISMDTIPQLSDSKGEALLFTFYTNNSMVPYFSVILVGKVKFASFTGKAKDFRESICGFFKGNYEGLKYEIQSAGKLKREIKKDREYNQKMNQKQLLKVISNVDGQSGPFAWKTVVKQQDNCTNWGQQLNVQMGYFFLED